MKLKGKSFFQKHSEQDEKQFYLNRKLFSHPNCTNFIDYNINIIDSVYPQRKRNYN